MRQFSNSLHARAVGAYFALWPTDQSRIYRTLTRLVEQGWAAVELYLPWFSVQYPTTGSQQITLRHLLNHIAELAGGAAFDAP